MFNTIKKRVTIGKLYACSALFDWYSKQIHTMSKEIYKLYIKSESLVAKMWKYSSELDEMEEAEDSA